MATIDRQVLIEKMQDIIAQYSTKLTVRQMYYRLVAAGVIVNSQSSYKRVGAVLVDARKDGDIDYEDIEDRTREVHITENQDYEAPAGYMNGYVDYIKELDTHYRIPTWWGQKKKVVVMLEKQALSSLFESITDKYAVDLVVCRGYPSLTLMYDMAERFKDNDDTIEEIQILYYGDFDPSGMDIERHVDDTLTNDFDVDFAIDRVAINKAQIALYNIIPAPAKATDSRTAGFVRDEGVSWQVELDAIDPPVLQKMIEEQIKAQIDWTIYNKRTDEEKRRQGKIKEWITTMFNPAWVQPKNNDEDTSPVKVFGDIYENIGPEDEDGEK
jgi:hypothetical protein